MHLVIPASAAVLFCAALLGLAGWVGHLIGRRDGFKAGWLKGWNARIAHEEADLKARWDAENEATRRQAQMAHAGQGRGRGGWG